MSITYQNQVIGCLAGTDKDNAPSASQHYTSASRIRFYDNLPQKLGGWMSVLFDAGATVEGAPRNLYSTSLATVSHLLIATNSNLYNLTGSQLDNITPVDTTSIAIPNSLATVYQGLANNPISMVNGSRTVTVVWNNHVLLPGDLVTLSGVPGAVRGIPAAELNTTHIVRTKPSNATFTIIVPTSATSTGTGGGAAVVAATAIIKVNDTAHGLAVGDRVKMEGAATTGGIPGTEINIEHIIRILDANNFLIECVTTATSAVAAAGGAATEYYPPIPAGAADAGYGVGYGLGLYGAGLYGVAKYSTSLTTQPRIWSFDRFGDLIVMTPGGQTGVYEWDGDVVIAPVLVTNAPTAVNYVFVDTNNFLVTLGASGVGNRVKWASQGTIDTWTASATNTAGEDDIEGANPFISHVWVNGENLLLTANQTYRFVYTGDEFVFQTTQVSSTQGIIAQNARIEVNGVAYWLAGNDFLMYSGGVIDSIPSNSKSGVNYLRNYFFQNINFEQASKCFVWYNRNYNEIWFHAPMGDSEECNMVARWNIDEGHWTFDGLELDRTAAEYPNAQSQYPRLINSSGTLYRHEIGYNDDTLSMPFSLTTKLFGGQNNTITTGRLLPESFGQVGDITVVMEGQKYQQSTTQLENSGPLTISTTTEEIPYRVNGRFWRYTVSQDVLNGFWRAGNWIHEQKDSTPR